MPEQDNGAVTAAELDQMTRRLGARADQLSLERTAALFGVDVLDVLGCPPPAFTLINTLCRDYVDHVLEPTLGELDRGHRAGTSKRS